MILVSNDRWNINYYRVGTLKCMVYAAIVNPMLICTKYFKAEKLVLLVKTN